MPIDNYMTYLLDYSNVLLFFYFVILRYSCNCKSTFVRRVIELDFASLLCQFFFDQLVVEMHIRMTRQVVNLTELIE